MKLRLGAKTGLNINFPVEYKVLILYIEGLKEYIKVYTMRSDKPVLSLSSFYSES
jgi:hypothetical protein